MATVMLSISVYLPNLQATVVFTQCTEEEVGIPINESTSPGQTWVCKSIWSFCASHVSRAWPGMGLAVAKTSKNSLTLVSGPGKLFSPGQGWRGHSKAQ